MDELYALEVCQRSSSTYSCVKPLISHCSKKIFLVSGHDIKLYSLISGQLLEVLRNHKKPIIGICQSPEVKNEILSCDRDGKVVMWDLGSSIKTKDFMLCKSEEMENEKVIYFSISSNRRIFYAIDNGKNKTLFVTDLNMKKRDKIAGKMRSRIPLISHSLEGIYIAMVLENKQFYYYKCPYRNENRREYYTSNTIVSLASHPTEDTVAVGDNIGRILLFYGAAGNKAVRKILHWHTLSVDGLCFSFKGSELYSCGGESVVVQWQLTEERRYFIARLGGPLQYISTDASNTHVIVLHKDKDITVIDSKERQIMGKITDLLLHNSDKPLPIGLLVHPSSNSLILNGRVGHLQFYDPFEDNLICHLDISMCNLISNERNKKLPNPEIIKACISSDGFWLVTCESCILSDRLQEVILKFWHFSEEKQRWELNTNIQMPHTLAINDMKFIPMDSTTSPLCVTCGEDNQFKMWKLLKYNDAKGNLKSHWNCIVSKEFCGLAASACSFSADGSLLTVAFHSFITMWKIQNDTCSLIGTLSKPFLKDRINHIAFGKVSGEETCLFASSSVWLSCWDLLSCSLSWFIPLNVDYLAVDPFSGCAAAFSTVENGTVHIFEPKSISPVATKSNISKRKILGAVFMLDRQNELLASEVPWNSPNHLVFIDENQIIFSLELEGKYDKRSNVVGAVTESGSLYATPFSALIADTQKIDDVDQIENSSSKRHYNHGRSQFMEILDNTRIHNMESFSSLLQECYSFIPSNSMKIDEITFPKEDSQIQYEKEDDISESISKDPSMHKLLQALKNINFDKIAEDLL